MVRFLRFVLAVGFAVIGGILGYQTGKWYSSLDVIQNLTSRTANLANLSTIGFTVIGVLLALLISSLTLSQLLTLNESLRAMPADEKIAMVFGVLLGLLFTLLVFPFLSPLAIGGKLLIIVVGVVLIHLGVQASLSMKS